jgi:hypothetical protein
VQCGARLYKTVSLTHPRLGACVCCCHRQVSNVQPGNTSSEATNLRADLGDGELQLAALTDRHTAVPPLGIQSESTRSSSSSTGLPQAFDLGALAQAFDRFLQPQSPLRRTAAACQQCSAASNDCCISTGPAVRPALPVLPLLSNCTLHCLHCRSCHCCRCCHCCCCCQHSCHSG